MTAAQQTNLAGTTAAAHILTAVMAGRLMQQAGVPAVDTALWKLTQKQHDQQDQRRLSSGAASSIWWTLLAVNVQARAAQPACASRKLSTSTRCVADAAVKCRV
jgi:hypothetical protein